MPAPSRRFSVSISDPQFGDRARRRGLVEDLLLGRLDFVVGRVLQIFDIFRRRGPAPLASSGRRDLAAALKDFQLAQPAFKPLAPAAQGLINRLGRRREAALQDRQGEADRPGALVVFQRLGAIELLAHIVGHLLVERASASDSL